MAVSQKKTKTQLMFLLLMELNHNQLQKVLLHQLLKKVRTQKEKLNLKVRPLLNQMLKVLIQQLNLMESHQPRLDKKVNPHRRFQKKVVLNQKPKKKVNHHQK